MKLTDLTEICEWTHGCAFKPGQAIFLEGDHAHTVYQVVRGVAKLVCVGSSGREIIVGLAGPGDFLDLVSILDGRPYGVSASALLGSGVELIAIPREVALRSVTLVQWLERLSLEELRRQRDWTVAMALERVERRAVCALTMLARRMGEPRGRGLRVQLLLNRQEFAELIGATTETAIRVLGLLRRQGSIEEQDGWVTLSESVCQAA